MVLSAQEHVTDSSAFDLASSQSLSSDSVPSNQVKQKVQTLWTALVLLSTFFCVELSAGIWSHSLSLLADAQHVLSDVAALGLALLAIWLSNSMSNRTIFRRYRLEVLAALVNGIGLACVAAWIVKEALVRLQSPDTEILGLPMLTTALIGLAVNGLNALCFHGCSNHDLNLRGAFLHLLADLVSSVGAVLAAIAVIWLNWTWADGVISLGVAVMIALFAAYLVIQSVNCLRGQVANITNTSCLCNLQAEVYSDRSSAEKLLFPSLQELIR
ncbi:cation diffusion facilitator family transporter [Dendronalium sp. ChiSLP03b]|uniref:cation diffusion facilitator family transporter n=1 Tax=Dendronalium sp. ChiSLP03b TaxID=3075381 RepID=UPI002AD2BF2E|nr:cation diffusion facilitator family transporter [Dendronalium sp. ChiSLP03b]MDZ8204764.1 cation diffusion facilitator family transporter [Dendronalium sp. ChiSLP03b]